MRWDSSQASICTMEVLLGSSLATGVGARHLAYQVEETALAVGIDTPVHRWELESVDVVTMRRAAAGAISRIEVAPRRVAAERGDAVIPVPIEVEVVVFIEQNRLIAIALHTPGALHLIRDQVRISGAVAVQEQEVGNVYHRFIGHSAASTIAGADGEPSAAPLMDARN